MQLERIGVAMTSLRIISTVYRVKTRFLLYTLPSATAVPLKLQSVGGLVHKPEKFCCKVR